MDKRIQTITIEKKSAIISALRQMDERKVKLLLVLDNDKFCSLLSIGDIQRAIIANIPLDTAVERILRKKVKVAKEGDDREDIIAYMKERRNDFMPVVDDNGNIADVIFWEDISTYKEVKVKEKFALPVVIMAGGKGTRLRPLTNILPKPLIPIGEQTLVEDIMDRFVECGCDKFYMSVNYKADVIKQYFEYQAAKHYNIIYFQEDKPLGTAGSLHLLADMIQETFFVSNCDIVIDEDYSEILKYHRENHNEITIVAAMKNISIPYGTLETKAEGLLAEIREKPNYTFKINTGMYILEPHLLPEIPKDEFYHITFLIEKLCNQNRRVGVYPINEGSWTDIGNWDEYRQFMGNE
jgi:dTDP-glucose pyrophosphorylase